jgi:hypothetical protein
LPARQGKLQKGKEKAEKSGNAARSAAVEGFGCGSFLQCGATFCDDRMSIADTVFYEDGTMKVDVYKRPEQEGIFSYLAVPEGRPIPEEATNIDWETAEHNIDLDQDNEPVHGLSAQDAFEQINAKGYAISRVHKIRIGPNV